MSQINHSFSKLLENSFLILVKKTLFVAIIMSFSCYVGIILWQKKEFNKSVDNEAKLIKTQFEQRSKLYGNILFEIIKQVQNSDNLDTRQLVKHYTALLKQEQQNSDIFAIYLSGIQKNKIHDSTCNNSIKISIDSFIVPANIKPRLSIEAPICNTKNYVTSFLKLDSIIPTKPADILILEQIRNNKTNAVLFSANKSADNNIITKFINFNLAGEEYQACYRIDTTVINDRINKLTIIGLIITLSITCIIISSFFLLKIIVKRPCTILEKYMHAVNLAEKATIRFTDNFNTRLQIQIVNAYEKTRTLLQEQEGGNVKLLQNARNNMLKSLYNDLDAFLSHTISQDVVELDVNKVIKESITILQKEIHLKKLNVKFKQNNKINPVMCDYLVLQQIVISILYQSIIGLGENKTIEVNIRNIIRKGIKAIEITIKDNGFGMHNMDHLSFKNEIMFLNESTAIKLAKMQHWHIEITNEAYKGRTVKLLVVPFIKDNNNEDYNANIVKIY